MANATRTANAQSTIGGRINALLRELRDSYLRYSDLQAQLLTGHGYALAKMQRPARRSDRKGA